MADKLTSCELNSVARRLSSVRDVRSLGLQLGVADYTINATLHNHQGNIQEAAYRVLNEWFHGRESRTEAFAELHRALTHPSVGLSLIANEVLNSSC